MSIFYFEVLPVAKLHADNGYNGAGEGGLLEKQ